MKSLHVVLPSLAVLGMLCIHGLFIPAFASSHDNPMVGTWDYSPPLNCEQIDRAFYADGEYSAYKGNEIRSRGLYTYTDHLALITLSYRAMDFEMTVIEDNQEKRVPMSGKRLFLFIWEMSLRAAQENQYKRKNLSAAFKPYEDVTINIEFSDQQMQEKDYRKCGDTPPARQTREGYERVLGAWDLDSNCRFPEFMFFSDGSVANGYFSNRARSYTDIGGGNWTIDGSTLKITGRSQYENAPSESSQELEILSESRDSLVVESQLELQKTADSDFHLISLRNAGDSQEETGRFLDQYFRKYNVDPKDERNEFVIGNWPTNLTLTRCF